MVYKLYQLTYDEVLVIDKEFEKHKSRAEYDKLNYGFEYIPSDEISPAAKTIRQMTDKKRGNNSMSIDDVDFF
ncbi:MAG: hypothetical protein V1781_05490 [Bacteroidota bacterium]